MKTTVHRTNSMIPKVALIAALLPLPAVHAAGTLTPQQRYQQESAACMKMGSADARANCLSEASTRLARTQPTPPSEAPAVLAENALKRCDPLPGDLKQDCIARMHGEGTVTGSVEGGGLYRELVTVVTEPQPETASTSGSADPSSDKAPSPQ